MKRGFNISGDTWLKLRQNYEEVLADQRRLVKELDIIINGENAAEQASLCDIVGQMRKEYKRRLSGRREALEFVRNIIPVSEQTEQLQKVIGELEIFAYNAKK